MSQDIEDLLITSREVAMAGRERFLVEAMVVEWRSPSELARSHGVARSWLYTLLARFREGFNQPWLIDWRSPRHFIGRWR